MPIHSLDMPGGEEHLLQGLQRLEGLFNGLPLPQMISRCVEEFAGAHYHGLLGFVDALHGAGLISLEEGGYVESFPRG